MYYCEKEQRFFNLVQFSSAQLCSAQLSLNRIDSIRSHVKTNNVENKNVSGVFVIWEVLLI